MDWKYILSQAQKAEDLHESKKDELLNTIAWYDFSNEKLDAKKHSALLQLCQEIMKYKSEQVEALLAELDEMAMKQAEEEANTRESDDRSSRSKKSLDSDEQDMKYRELKAKYRKLQKHVDANKEEREQLKQNVKMLEQERVYLQKELRNAHQKDDSASDISETVKDQQRNLMDNVQQKNAQISQLLTDIENVESDNLQLRAHLSSLRDELTDATEKLQSLVNDNKLLRIQLDETQDVYSKLQAASGSYQRQIDDLLEDKEARELEFEQFANEIDARIENWKQVLEAKNKEIDQLKSKTNQTSGSQLRQSTASSKSSSSLLHVDEAQVLQKAIAEREENIIRLQKQLEKATKEMLKSAQVLKQVTKDRDSYSKKCEKMNVMCRDVKKQLKAAHQRSQELSDDVQYLNNLVKDKENDIEDVVKKIQDPNVQKIIKELDQTKSEKRSKEKKVIDLVKSCNKLRNTLDILEKENVSLRDRLGLTEDDYISTKSLNLSQKRNKKLFEGLKQKLEITEEEKLQYRIEVQKLSKIISNLSDQLIDLGETPIVDGQEIDVSNLRNKETKDIEIQMTESTKAEYNSLLEENDALRKGLHEILESIQAKQEISPREIKSETLEVLLHALDAKHVSGWYHPAMRLQAEVHTLQGSNATFREQLRLAREELDIYKDKSHMISIDNQLDSSNATVLANLNNHLINVLKNYGPDYPDNEASVKLAEKLEYYKKEFLLVQENISVLYNQYKDEKTKWENDFASMDDKLKELIDSHQALEEQLRTIKLLTDPETEEEVKIKTISESSAKLVIANRKMVHLENLDKRYKNEINNLKVQLLEESQESLKKQNNLKRINFELEQRVEKLEHNTSEKFIFPEDIIKLQNDYDSMLIKQRELQKTLDDVSAVSSNELEVLKRKVTLLEGEKLELSKKFVESKCEIMSGNELERKLAQSEVNEMSERQRANHTNSLYELVKEQLAKSEEKHQEYQKYNGEILQKNLLLQESVKTLEDKLIHYVDAELYQKVQQERDRLIDESQQCAGEVSALRDEQVMLRKDMATRTLWANLDQYECHSLRHQIVDLQATGDDKAVIARLSSEVIMARMAETEVRKKLDEMVNEMTMTKKEMEAKNEGLIKEIDNTKGMISILKRQNSNLEMIIKQQRKHYFGFVPYTTQEKLAAKLGEILKEKKLVYETLTRTEQIEFDCRLIKETLETKTDVVNELNQLIRDGDAQARALEKWFLDKTNVQLQDLRSRRVAEFKQAQLNQATARLRDLEAQIALLETELLQALCLREIQDSENEVPISVLNTPQNSQTQKQMQLQTTTANIIEIAPVSKIPNIQNVTTQTNFSVQLHPETIQFQDSSTPNSILEEQIERNEISRKKDEELHRSKQKILELEMNISLLRQQMGDKQSQISFYEKHILEMQQAKLEAKEAREVQSIDQLKKTMAEKERIIFELQSLLKKDRDEHSLAAARLQEELKQLQVQLLQAQQESAAEAKHGKPARAAVEYYIQQVHALEKLTTELQTSVSTLSTQLQASREECVRWRTLSNDRLQSVDELRLQLEEQHKNELEAYKSECEKWRNEVNTLQLYINAYKKDIVDLRPNIEKELKDKDNKIHELLVHMRQLKTELRRKTQNTGIQRSPIEENLEEIKESLQKEQEVLKKRCEQLLGREKNAREEIRNLKGQLMKRPALSARSDVTNPAANKEQQARKILALEKEVNELKEKLEREMALNEAHKAKVSDNFDKWSKLKYWQQTAEKTKAKLREKGEECEKIQQTVSSYRMLIERLEREKHNLEVRLKNLKSTGGGVTIPGGGDAFAVYSSLEAENAKLKAEISTLRVKLEQQQHHSGALSSVMLQDKLEAQERKIAVLELSAKGGGEVRAELERLQNLNAGLQKANLRLEAENLDMQLDLEKSSSEVPHLREQIIYLENYIKLLKSTTSDCEKQKNNETTQVSTASDHPETKRVSELERTVLALKRVVEKLQVENKRLTNGSTSRTFSDRSGSGDRFKREYNLLKQQLDEKVDKVASLEKELNAARQRIESFDGSVKAQLNDVREQLEYKDELLEKLKILLQRAAVKEKALLDQINILQAEGQKQDSN